MRRWFAAAVGLALILLVGWLWIGVSRENDWPIRNLPVEPGSVICFGDSLVAGVGASSAETTYPAVLSRLLGRTVLPLGENGRTVGEGLRDLRANPSVRAPLVIVTLGGNDILRRRPLEETGEDLAALFEELQSRQAVVAYTEVLGIVPGKRARMHRELCREYGVILIPDILDDLIRNQDYLSDQIHPNDAGYRIMAERVAHALQPYLEE